MDTEDEIDGRLNDGQSSLCGENRIMLQLIQVEGDDLLSQASDEDKRAYDKAMDLQVVVEEWKKKDHDRSVKADIQIIETGIRLEEKKCVIYIPTRAKEEICAQLKKDIKDIDQAIIADLNNESRRKHSYQPGHTGLLFGDESTCTLGTYLKGTLSGDIFALSSHHGSTRPYEGRDIFVHRQEGVGRFGNCVAHVYQTDPVVDACLIKVDQDLLNDVTYPMSVGSGQEAIPILLYAEGENGVGGAPAFTQLKVFKVGFMSEFTPGRLTELNRIVHHEGECLKGNYVTVREGAGQPFAGPGDSGAVVARAVRMSVTDRGYFYPALSVHYLGDDRESFSFPINRAIELLGERYGEPLELVAQNQN